MPSFCQIDACPKKKPGCNPAIAVEMIQIANIETRCGNAMCTGRNREISFMNIL